MGMEQPMRKFYSVKEAADYLQVDYKVVYRLVRQGDIPSSRVGWQYRMTQEDLNTYLNVQRVKQTHPHTHTTTTSEQHKPLNGGHTMAGDVQQVITHGKISKVQARQMEQNLINRFNQKVRSIDTIRHPKTKQVLHIENWDGLYEKSENLDKLMEALNTAFLDRTTLATTPRNTRVRYTVPSSPDLIIEVRFVSHLQKLCQNGEDSEAATLEDLMISIDEVEEEQEQNGSVLVAGLASPTGWNQEAIDYIVNSNRGNTYTHPQISIFLLDLSSEAEYYNEHDAISIVFAGLFRLATESEDQVALEEQMIAELVERSGLILSDFAREAGVSLELALAAARGLALQESYRLLEDKETGWILVTT
jgi:excisionase family DNA binding protein